MALFESYERREKQVLAALNKYGINTIEEAAEVTKAAGLDVYKMVEGIQPICFENAKWAYTVGAAIADVYKRQDQGHGIRDSRVFSAALSLI